MKYVKVSKCNIDEYVKKYDLLVCRIRKSRNKAKRLAVFELSTVLGQVGGIFVFNGPLGDVRGLVSFFVPKGMNDELTDILKTVGYCDQFYKLDFTLEMPGATNEIKSVNEYFWKGRRFNVIPFYTECKKQYQKQSVNNRMFAIYQEDGTVKHVKGYRGDGSEAGRRGLPLEDAKMMVNLVKPYTIQTLMDPFAGGGGILHAAKLINPSLYVISADIDRLLEPGLSMYADKHFACDARKVDLGGKKVDAVVTEIPFSKNYTHVAIEAFYNLLPNISDTGKMLVMCHVGQTEQIKKKMEKSNLCLIVDKEVNRKGTSVNILLWSKCREFYKKNLKYFQMIKTVI